MNFHLPSDIAVSQAVEVAKDFNPRADACSRTYHYLIWNRPVRSPFQVGRAAHVRHSLDAGAMHDAIRLLLGRHDMSAFIPVKSESNRERTIFDASCVRQGDMITVKIEASGFMKQMVRAIVGTLILVGRGRLTLSDFAGILELRDRTRGGDTAPACGLYLVAVNYAVPVLGADSTSISGYPFHGNVAPVTCEETR